MAAGKGRNKGTEMRKEMKTKRGSVDKASRTQKPKPKATRKEKKAAFVTVGTTKFEQLIRAIDSPLVLSALLDAGYTHLTLQIGHGEYVPKRILPEGKTKGQRQLNKRVIHVEYFRLAPSLAPYMLSSSLIISHAGAGSLFEALGAGRRIIAVPNSLLMVNHQEELAAHLAQKGFLLHADLDCDGGEAIPRAIAQMEKKKFKQYKPGGGAKQIVKDIDSLF
jgi:beta-1,4-N-acetylglucosaminyltransferase